MKILVIHASAGAGHKKAAEAVYNRLKETSHEVVFADVLDYTNSVYKDNYRNGYTFLVTKYPAVWGLFFWLTDIPWLLSTVQLARRLLNSINAKKLEQYLIKEQFDCIISTHFFPGEVAAYLKRTGKILSKLICVVTDFDVHSIWLSAGFDYYTVACDDTKEKLIKFGVAPEKIIVLGIPTDKKFSLLPDRDKLCHKLEIKKDAFTVLIATGSFGMGPIRDIVWELKGYQILVVCGNNKTLFEQLRSLQTELVKVHGLVNNMDELMAVADCMITKPGGLSISEALVRGLPMIFFSAIPGQENNNVEVLKKHGIGVKNDDIRGIVSEVKKLSNSHEALLRAKENTRILARPSAAADIIKLIS